MSKGESFEVSWPSRKKGTVRFIDLTQTLGPDSPGAHTKFEAQVFSTYEKDGIYARKLSHGEHSGTHVDAPSHFTRGQPYINEIPLSQLVGPAAVINVIERVKQNPDYRISLNDIQAWEKKNGEIPGGAFVLAATGWGERWSDKGRYSNVDAKGIGHYPGFEAEVLEFLVRERDIRGVGIDCSGAGGGMGGIASHPIMGRAGKLIVSNLKNLDKLPAVGALIIAGVIPYEEGSGGQARVIAVLP